MTAQSAEGVQEKKEKKEKKTVHSERPSYIFSVCVCLQAVSQTTSPTCAIRLLTLTEA